MRLKSYTAPSMAEAMQMVRQELGEDAIIVSTQRAAGAAGVRITAALEAQAPEAALFDLPGGGEDLCEHRLRHALAEHGVPERLIERLALSARDAALTDPTLSCAAALEAGFAFAPLPEHGSPRPFMLVGPPGAGKSIAVAKLAARSVLKHRKVGIITTDGMRAGAVEQLAAFTRILEIDLVSARGPEALQRAVEEAAASFDLVFIDSPGLNPFKRSDMDYLAAMIEAADVEPILVLPGGGDPLEAAEIADCFATIGATRLFGSRLDTTRRVGALVTAAEAGQLIFCDVSVSPHVASGLCPVTPVALARLILPPEPEQQDNDNQFWTEPSA
ncbi:GTP-binding protein [Telmatospirillum sp. J64-1]|uniref:flagellar biosynthesis protein FlhF n=1 Tax=Telmatospirillum sp. J64-1 TaxID=2502183 RepID=UPI00115D1C11|nr:GTP-binding protein [Telmatospirillum sp. J64-1]